MKTESVGYKYNTISYQGHVSDDDKRHIGTAEVAATTGTVAAAGSRPGLLKTFRQFGFDTKKLEQATSISREMKGAGKYAEQTVREAKGLWAGLSRNTKRFSEAIIKWGQNVKTNKFIKPLLQSCVYKKAAWGIGGAAALFVFVSGVGNMTKQVLNIASDKTDRFVQIACGTDLETEA